MYGGSPYGQPQSFRQQEAPAPTSYLPPTQTYAPVQPQTYAPQVAQPNAFQMAAQGLAAATSSDGGSPLSVGGNSAARITPEDYVLVKKFVENIRAAHTDEFSFDELKTNILGFKLANTKEATRIWKLVDAQGTRILSKEGKLL
jgi:hypothetical protein